MKNKKRNRKRKTMDSHYEIPDSFWRLFRSPNRELYIEAMLRINEEYEYNSYFLSREICVQILSDYFASKRVSLKPEEEETDLDLLEPPATRTLNWLLKAQWLVKLEDYYNQVTNIVIPDYASIFVDAFVRLYGEEEEETDLYIQNIYAILFSFQNDEKAGFQLLKTALVNTRRLNKSLQDLLHSMDRFFGSLLEQEHYSALLAEHLEGYVDEIIRKKYHVLKTSDNFYLYKSDIKKWIHNMQESPAWLLKKLEREKENISQEEVFSILDGIERGFDDIEHRIANMDREHLRYVKATVVRLNYLLNGEGDMKGLLIQLLKNLEWGEKQEERLGKLNQKINLSDQVILSDQSLYQKRGARKKFTDDLTAEEVREELSREEILRLNRVQNRYSRQQIEEFLESRQQDGMIDTSQCPIETTEDFEKLILAYDYAVQRNSRYRVVVKEGKQIQNGEYNYPDLLFIEK
jgi:hypothetical protein